MELGPLVAAATTAGLSYLQHIVTMPTLGRPPAPDNPATPPLPPAAGGGWHERVHGDLLVFRRPGGGSADA